MPVQGPPGRLIVTLTLLRLTLPDRDSDLHVPLPTLCSRLRVQCQCTLSVLSDMSLLTFGSQTRRSMPDHNLPVNMITEWLCHGDSCTGIPKGLIRNTPQSRVPVDK